MSYKQEIEDFEQFSQDIDGTSLKGMSYSDKLTFWAITLKNSRATKHYGNNDYNEQEKPVKPENPEKITAYNNTNNVKVNKVEQPSWVKSVSMDIPEKTIMDLVDVALTGDVQGSNKKPSTKQKNLVYALMKAYMRDHDEIVDDTANILIGISRENYTFFDLLVSTLKEMNY